MRHILLGLLLCLPLSAQNFEIVTQIVSTNGIESTLIDVGEQMILAKPKANTSKEAVEALAKKHKLKDKTKVKKLKWKQFEVPQGQAKRDVIRQLQQSGLFEAVQEDRTYKLQDTIPNDPFFGQLWGMTNIGAPKAWDLTREAPNVVVAVVDTGIDFTHPDLVNNLWTGPNGEHGYQVRQGVITPGGTDDHGHGTHCSGTIAGVGNNGVGVAGVAWRSQIMAMKVLHGGSGSSTDIALGVEKLVELKESGVPIVASNHSYGGGGEDQFMLDAFELLDQADIFAAVAAGNSNVDIDSTSFIPAVFPFANIISTMASDIADRRANFSNFGLVRCDIAAPGVGVLSCTRSNTYSSWSGTSMAAPHVCGVALLVRARNPSLSARAVRDLILDEASYDSIAGLSNNNTSARINLDKTIRNPRLFESPFELNRPPIIGGVTPYTVVPNSAEIQFAVNDPDGDSVRTSVSSSGSIFINDFSGFFRQLTAKNGFKLQPGVNNVTITSQPFAYQVAGSLVALASDNRGGGASAPTGFEVLKQNSLRRQIQIKTWTARTNAAAGSISWVFDVQDDAKADYLYLFSWTQGFGTGTWFGFTPSPNELSATIPNLVGKFSLRVFVMDKYFNWLNADAICFPSNSTTFPRSIATVSPQEGNAPFEVVYDLSASTGPINYRLVSDFFTGETSINAPRITNVITEPTIKFSRATVLSTVTMESDSMIIPVFSSKFANLSLTNIPPPDPTPITNLVAVTNLNAGLSGNTVLLRWSDLSTNEDRYVVEASYKKQAFTSSWMTVGTTGPDQDFFVHVPNVRRATWTYRVKACGGQLCAPNSNLASVRVK